MTGGSFTSESTEKWIIGVFNTLYRFSVQNEKAEQKHLHTPGEQAGSLLLLNDEEVFILTKCWPQRVHVVVAALQMTYKLNQQILTAATGFKKHPVVGQSRARRWFQVRLKTCTNPISIIS